MACDAMMREVRPSLDRLKALDSLPDLESQLQEARQLCNRPARAEMVSKWLLEKLKSGQEFSGNVEVWETLLSAFRIIPPHQLASILASHSFFNLCRPSIDESKGKPEDQSISVISRILNLLIEIASAPEATHLKAVLSLSAPDAASFMGIWLDAALTFYDVVESTRPTYNLLSAGIDLWNLRKPSSDENEVFAKHCLLPITKLLHIVSEYEENYWEYCGRSEDEEYEGFEFQRKKRSAGSDTPRPGHQSFLESMLARHVFVPARTAFFKSRDAAEYGARRQVGSQDPTFTLRSMFATLRKSSTVDNLDRNFPSDLLGIVLRCLPMNTPKHRIQEQPWVDAVFEALLECMKAGFDDEDLLHALVGTLSTIQKRHASLSKHVLYSIVEQYSNLDSGEKVNWKLVSLVIELDDDVFADDDKAITLMTDVTHASIDRLDEVARSLLVASEQQLADTLRNDIVMPLMHAFTDRRRLEDFVHMWAAQISSTRTEKILPLWTDLAIGFESLMEKSLTHDQVLSIFDRYFAAVEHATDAHTANESSPSISLLNANVVVLDAILGGVQSEMTADKLHERCGKLLDLILGIENGQSAQKFLPMVSQLWSLAARAFELWFPKWAMVQTNRATITRKAMDILQSNGYITAKVQESASNVRDAARAFVATVCFHLRRYDTAGSSNMSIQETPESLCEASVFSIFRGQATEARWSILLQFPTLMSDLDVQTFATITEECICSDSQIAIRALQALLAQVFHCGNGAQVDALVDVLLRHILQDPSTNGSIFNPYSPAWTYETPETKTLKALATLSPSCISRRHREILVNAICRRQLTDTAQDFGKNAQSWRFAVLNLLFKLPNPTCDLATDPEIIWRIAEFIRTLNMDSEFLQPLEELTGQLSSHLLATQDQERSRSMLIKLSEGIKGFIEVVSKNSDLHTGSEQTLTVVKALIRHMESTTKEELQSKLAYRTPRIIKQFIEGNIKLIQRELRQVIMMEDSISTPVKTLLAMPQTLIQLSGVDVASIVVPLMETAMSQLMDLHIRDWDSEEHELQRISVRNEALVESFSLACSVSVHGYNPIETNWALEISKLHLTPVQQNSFLNTFGLNIERLQSQQYATLTNDLLRSIQAEEDESSATTTPLVEICATKLDKIKLNDTILGMPKLLSILLTQAEKTSNPTVRRRSLTCIATALKGNSSLLTQYCIELALTGSKKILDDPSKAPSVFMEICQIVSAMLLQYRSRLHGRFHLMVPVFQALLSRLFQPAASSRANIHMQKSTTKHAQAISKLLTLFCEPPQSKRSSKTLALIDEARKEQAYVGKSVQYVLHHWCTQMLNGILETGAREAITPGLWSMIEAMEMGDAEGVKSLSTAMNNSERAILRGIYEDWRRFGKWRGA